MAGGEEFEGGILVDEAEQALAAEDEAGRGYLPGIPAAEEVEAKGVNLGDMQSKLLAKVEELTLHMIAADERNNRLERQSLDLEKRNRELQERLARLEAGQATH